MACYSERKGKAAELVARYALMAAGWTVAKPDTDEPFDIVAKDPVNSEWYTLQVKSVRQRNDRGGDLVIVARKGNGEVYTKSDAAYLVGVWETEGGPRVFLVDNREIGEYWCSEARASERWVELAPTFYIDDRTAGPASNEGVTN